MQFEAASLEKFTKIQKSQEVIRDATDAVLNEKELVL